MSAITCDQAIFTSVPGVMGQGYRIIAASRGLKPAEKQTITRLSPSHDALCRLPEAPSQLGVRGPSSGFVAGTPGKAGRPSVDGADDRTDDVRVAAAFYVLPTGRLCAAYSCHAGAEHTGRGGQRVYTHNVIFDADEFALCGYNPCNVFRAMNAAGLTTPQLTPTQPLPEIQLIVEQGSPLQGSDVCIPDRMPIILQALLNEQCMIVNTLDGWLDMVEALLISLPGPLRSKIGFSAGLRYSTGRPHRLQLLFDDGKAARSHPAGPSTQYMDCTGTQRSATGRQVAATRTEHGSAWLTFVERHWKQGDFGGLARRTSRNFDDVSPCGRERIAGLYNQIDDLPNAETADTLAAVAGHLESTNQGADRELHAEWVQTARTTLTDRFTCAAWRDAKAHWPTVVSLWRRSTQGTAFAQPLIRQLLQRATTSAPMEAAEAALDVARDLPASDDSAAHEAMLDDVLGCLADWIASKSVCAAGPKEKLNPAQLDRLQALCDRWRTLKPDSAVHSRITEHLLALRQPDESVANG
ncbi:MAG: hypothetical protein IIC01_10595 [Planctomycetes bacterium]|nr:hypothetical protein [Planctomycetota bacterium]